MADDDGTAVCASGSKSDNLADHFIYGPILAVSSNSESSDGVKIIGPELPTDAKVTVLPDLPVDGKKIIGPELPMDAKVTTSIQLPMDVRKTIGPELPPGLCIENLEDDDCYGPTLPPTTEDKEPQSCIGPSLPPEMSSVSDEYFGPTATSSECDVGPMPAVSVGEEEQALEYARRRLELEAKSAEGDKLVREEWLIKVPKQGPIASLTARSFKRTKDTSEPDQSWEDTPQTKRSMTQVRTTNNDSRKEQKLITGKQVEKDRSESLIEIHMKGKEGPTGKKLTTDSGARVPFNRDQGMGYSGKPSGSVEELKKRAGELSARFGSKDYL